MSASHHGISRPILVKGGTVLSLDDSIGDLDRADLLIADGTIVAVEPDLSVDDAEVIDAADAIVMPGFVDSHRHLWEGLLRNLLPDSTLMDYLVEVNGRLGAVFRPEDAETGTLLGALAALNAGVTTVLDWSHIQNTPDHTEATISGLKASGIRAVFGYGPPSNGLGPFWMQPGHAYPDALSGVRARHFSSESQLLTLALAAVGPEVGPFDQVEREWRAARDAGARIAVHVGTGAAGRVGKLGKFAATGLLGSDTTYIHGGGLTDDEWRLIADTGGAVSLSVPIEMQMGHGGPAIQAALDHGLAPSLSVDVECNQPADFFTQMRAAFAAQRGAENERRLSGSAAERPLVTTREVVRWATVNGAAANGLSHAVGSLTPGKRADVIVLKTNRINTLATNNAYGSVVLSMDTSNVDTVLVDGRIVKRGGQLVGVDLAALQRRAELAREHVLLTSGYNPSVTAPTISDVHKGW